MDNALLVESDVAIAQAAASALTWCRAVAPDTVEVAVDDGWLTLTGVVTDLQQRGAAERAVRGLRGVRGVSNTVRIVRPPCRQPQAIDALRVPGLASQP
jgi:osmotically-inducible protein OsmY